MRKSRAVDFRPRVPARILRMRYSPFLRRGFWTLSAMLALSVFVVAQRPDYGRADSNDSAGSPAAESASTEEADSQEGPPVARSVESDTEVVARPGRLEFLSRLLGVTRFSGRSSVTAGAIPISRSVRAATRPRPLAAPGGSSRSVSLLSTGRPWSLPSRPWASPSNPW